MLEHAAPLCATAPRGGSLGGLVTLTEVCEQLRLAVPDRSSELLLLSSLQEATRGWAWATCASREASALPPPLPPPAAADSSPADADADAASALAAAAAAASSSSSRFRLPGEAAPMSTSAKADAE